MNYEADLTGYLGPSFFAELIGLVNKDNEEEEEDDANEGEEESFMLDADKKDTEQSQRIDLECVYAVPPEFLTSRYMEDEEEKEREKKRMRKQEGEEEEEEKERNTETKENEKEKIEKEKGGSYEDSASVAEEIRQSRSRPSSSPSSPSPSRCDNDTVVSNYVDREAVDRLVATAKLKKLEQEREKKEEEERENERGREKEKEKEGEKRQRTGSALRVTRVQINTPSNQLEIESGRFYLPLHASRKDRSYSWNERCSFASLFLFC